MVKHFEKTLKFSHIFPFSFLCPNPREKAHSHEDFRIFQAVRALLLCDSVGF